MRGLYGKNIDNPVAYCRLHDCYLEKPDARHRCGYKQNRKSKCNHLIVLNNDEKAHGLTYECWMYHNKWRERHKLRKVIKELVEKGDVEEAKRLAEGLK